MSLWKKNLLSIVIGCIVLTTTVLIYLLLPITKSSIDLLTFLGMILSQSISLATILLLNRVTGRRKLALSAGGYTAVFVYVAASAALSILFSAFFRTAFSIYIILEIVWTAAFFIASILIYAAGCRIAADGERVQADLCSVKAVEGSIELIRTDPQNAVYKNRLDRIYEAYKNSDQSRYVPTDEKINGEITVLNDLLRSGAMSEQMIGERCESILQLIRQRGLEVNRLKLGGI